MRHHQRHHHGPTAADCEPLTTLSSLIMAQDRADPYEKSVWLKRGAVKITQDGPQKGLWRSPHGHFVLPILLLGLAIRNAHGQDHWARGEVIKCLQAVWWSPYLAATVDRTLHECFVAQFSRMTFKLLGIKQKFGCVYHPQSQGTVERVNGTLKAKLAKILADSGGELNWVETLPLALMCMRSQTNRLTHLTPHKMLTGQPMPLPYLRGPYEGPLLEQLERELLASYVQHLT